MKRNIQGQATGSGSSTCRAVSDAWVNTGNGGVDVCVHLGIGKDSEDRHGQNNKKLELEVEHRGEFVVWEAVIIDKSFGGRLS